MGRKEPEMEALSPLRCLAACYTLYYYTYTHLQAITRKALHHFSKSVNYIDMQFLEYFLPVKRLALYKRKAVKKIVFFLGIFPKPVGPPPP